MAADGHQEPKATRAGGKKALSNHCRAVVRRSEDESAGDGEERADLSKLKWFPPLKTTEPRFVVSYNEPEYREAIYSSKEMPEYTTVECF